MDEAGVSDRILLEQGDANHLKDQDGSFDVAMMTGMLFSCKNRVRVRSEVYRVLKPGGEAWIYDFDRGVSKEDAEVMKEALRSRGVGRFWRMFTGLAMRSSYSTRELSEILEDTPFGDYRVERIHINKWPVLRTKLIKPLIGSGKAKATIRRDV